MVLAVLVEVEGEVEIVEIVAPVPVYIQCYVLAYVIRGNIVHGDEDEEGDCAADEGVEFGHGDLRTRRRMESRSTGLPIQ